MRALKLLLASVVLLPVAPAAWADPCGTGDPPFIVGKSGYQCLPLAVEPYTSQPTPPMSPQEQQALQEMLASPPDNSPSAKLVTPGNPFGQPPTPQASPASAPLASQPPVQVIGAAPAPSETPSLYFKTIPAPNGSGTIEQMEPPPSPAPAPVTPSPAQYLNPYNTQSTFPNPNQNVPTTIGASPQPQAKVSPVAAPVIQGIGFRYSPGGISLSKAAAERLALNIDIEGVGYRDGRVILAGPHDSSTRIDAGLFLTALRLACGPSDPYFSLDPIDGSAWAKQADEASKVAWKRLEPNFSGRPANRFAIETFSVNQRYPALWSELFSQYPELRTKLVFRPGWLSQTRFGRILYKADVLLKELSTGTSVVDPKLALRASTVRGYVPSDQRRAVRGFLAEGKMGGLSTSNTNRMWFDLLPDAAPQQDQPAPGLDALDRNKVPGLYAELSQRGLVDGPAMTPFSKAILVTDGGATDLSQVYPKMFVRRHDYATGKDVAGVDPELDRLAHDVDDRFKAYADAYVELRDLADVFRAYIASVSLIKQAPEACRVAQSPLSAGEVVAVAMPEFRQSELVLTAAQYMSSDRWWMIHGGSVSGGISLRGKQFYANATVQRRTSLTAEMAQVMRADVAAQRWRDVASGREYVAFTLAPPPPRAPIVAEKVAN